MIYVFVEVYKTLVYAEWTNHKLRHSKYIMPYVF